MRRALNLLRPALHYRRDAFSQGLQAAGFSVVTHLPNPRPGDALLIWNRYGGGHATARLFDAVGATVLVAENCPLGNSWRAGTWCSLASDNPATVGGNFEAGGPARWDSWGQELAEWRGDEGELIALGQRSIGHEGIASPSAWAEKVARRYAARVRPHPGTDTFAVALEDDLLRARGVLTWASSAALRALMLGVPVWYEHPAFIGAQACARLGESAVRDDAARLAMFRRLAWSMWEIEEVRSGEAIRRLCRG